MLTLPLMLIINIILRSKQLHRHILNSSLNGVFLKINVRYSSPYRNYRYCHHFSLDLVFCKPLARLFNLSIATWTLPTQWKIAFIRLFPKVPAPTAHTYFRPISIIPVLIRMMEKVVVRQYLYPSFNTPPPTLSFSDQFSFRPKCSTVAALIYILRTITQLPTTHQYVVVIALDFSKAFDTVCHATLLRKMADLNIPDHAYSWLVFYFSDHSYCTKYDGSTSSMLDISSSIIQGSIQPVMSTPVT